MLLKIKIFYLYSSYPDLFFFPNTSKADVFYQTQSFFFLMNKFRLFGI